jgi:hypothetical protein
MKHLNSLSIVVSLIIATGCADVTEEVDNSITLDSNEVSLASGGQYTIDATSTKAILYSTDNEFNATVSNSGVITAGKVGKTKIHLTNGFDEKSISVTTYSTNLLYPDPILSFGSSKSTITSKLGAPAYEASSGNTVGIRYDNATNTTDGTAYFFENDRLTLVQTRVKSEFTSLLSSYLNDRFAAAGQVDGTFFYFNAFDSSKITVGVGLALYSTSYWNVTYMAYTNSTTASFNISNSPKIIDLF